MTEENSLIPDSGNSQEVTRSIENFSRPLAGYLEHIGLPVEGILSPVDERRKVIFGLPETITHLTRDEIEKSEYLSKFSVAVAAGLFDGALNYLWDQTILSLRQTVTEFDLDYFFSVAESLNPRYTKLATPDDLKAISDHDLLEICRRIGFFSDTIYKRLETVNYFRNHASAAHPNDSEISGIELLSYLEYCIKYAIKGEFDHSVIQIKVLFENIRNIKIPEADTEIIINDLVKQPLERIEDFGISLFGLYCDSRQTQDTKTNIENLFPGIWEAFSEDTKYKIGSKYGHYRKHGETEKKDAADRILSIANGLSYRDEDSLAQELIDKLQELKSVHYQWNNFYNEYTYAVSIKESLPVAGIPQASRKDFVKVISICYTGNGKGYREGVDERAEPLYAEFIDRFKDLEIATFLKLFLDIEFKTDLDKMKPISRMKKLAEKLKNKSQSIHIKNALDLIIKCDPRNLHRIGSTGEFERAMRKIK